MKWNICVHVDKDTPFPERLIIDIITILISRDRHEEDYKLLAQKLCAYDPTICDYITSYWHKEKDERLGDFLEQM